MNLRALQDADFTHKTVIMRVDFNVPINDGQVADGFRIDATLPAIKLLLSRDCKIVIISHMGDPKGKNDPRFTLSQVKAYLEQGLQKKVFFIDDCLGKNTKSNIENMAFGEVILLENLRFHPEEEQNDEKFAKILASYGDIYVNEAFSSIHRNHASIAQLSSICDSYAGPSLISEISNIEKLVLNPKPKMGAIIGGAKISTKINLIKSLLTKIDVLFIAGAMAHVFYKADRIDIGSSFYERDCDQLVQEIREIAKEKNVEIVLPIDFVAASNLESANIKRFKIGDIMGGNAIFDLGEGSINLFKEKFKELATIIWNGPVGAFENQPFDQGTLALAREIANLTSSNGLISIAGGGDTASALDISGTKEQFSYVSTGGGAFLAYLESSKQPGIGNLIVN